MRHFDHKQIAIALCGLGITAAALGGTAFGRGGGGGGMHSGSFGHQSFQSIGGSSNFRVSSQNFLVSRQNFSSQNLVTPHGPTNHGTIFSKNLKFQNSFLKSGKGGPFWKKYWCFNAFCGAYGWGWYCWLDPWCDWVWYEPVPVVEYCNPYCGGAIDGVDYSQAISQMGADTVEGDESDPYAAARTAFMQGDLSSAQSWIAQAVAQSPHNSNVEQLHSLILFAAGDYRKSAAVAHAVMQSGPGWTWETLQSCYTSPDTYTQELRALEHYVAAHSAEADARLLLAYHYLMLNHREAAGRQLAQVVELEPKDKLAKRILTAIPTDHIARGSATAAPAKSTPTQTVVAADSKSINAEPSTPIASAASSPSDSAATKTNSKVVVANKPVNVPTTSVAEAASVTDAAQKNASGPQLALEGTWKATPEKKVEIDLTLTHDGSFTWTFKANGQTKTFKGKYTQKGNNLSLTRDSDQEAMAGVVERTANGFGFRMNDADDSDPGLTFSR